MRMSSRGSPWLEAGPSPSAPRALQRARGWGQGWGGRPRSCPFPWGQHDHSELGTKGPYSLQRPGVCGGGRVQGPGGGRVVPAESSVPGFPGTPSTCPWTDRRSGPTPGSDAQGTPNWAKAIGGRARLLLPPSPLDARIKLGLGWGKGGGVTPGGQGFCPLPVPLQRGAFRAIMLALPLASAWSTGLALTPHPGDSSAMSPPGVVANTGTRLAVVLRARRWAEAAPREAGRLGVGQATARCGQQRWRGRAEQEPLARAGGGTQARLGRGPS